MVQNTIALSRLSGAYEVKAPTQIFHYSHVIYFCSLTVPRDLRECCNDIINQSINHLVYMMHEIREGVRSVDKMIIDG